MRCSVCTNCEAFCIFEYIWITFLSGIIFDGLSPFFLLCFIWEVIRITLQTCLPFVLTVHGFHMLDKASFHIRFSVAVLNFASIYSMRRQAFACFEYCVGKRPRGLQASYDRTLRHAPGSYGSPSTWHVLKLQNLFRTIITLTLKARKVHLVILWNSKQYIWKQWALSIESSQPWWKWKCAVFVELGPVHVQTLASHC